MKQELVKLKSAAIGGALIFTFAVSQEAVSPVKLNMVTRKNQEVNVIKTSQRS